MMKEVQEESERENELEDDDEARREKETCLLSIDEGRWKEKKVV